MKKYLLRIKNWQKVTKFLRKMTQIKLIRMRKSEEYLRKSNPSIKKIDCQTYSSSWGQNLPNLRGLKPLKKEEAKELLWISLASTMWKLVCLCNKRSNWPNWRTTKVNKKREENNPIKCKVMSVKRTKQVIQTRKRINKT